MAKKKKVVRKKKKPAKKKKIVLRRKSPKARKPKRAKRRPRGSNSFETPAPLEGRGLGAGSGGQSGDIQGLSRAEDVDSESVEELAEEGQGFEAEVVSGVENALDPDEDEVRTREDVAREDE
ncbi:MAG TPA: hypothetical protein VN822_13965 [Candidatus Acidoferrales bacterium]|nr:hypothetical protein [Candidatus Acidoferrales bacterium]